MVEFAINKDTAIQCLESKGISLLVSQHYTMENDQIVSEINSKQGRMHCQIGTASCLLWLENFRAQNLIQNSV